MKRFFSPLIFFAVCALFAEPADFKAQLKLADKGNADACMFIGKCYYNGMFNTPVNIIKAVKYLEIAAKGGYSSGMYNLGMIYYYAEGGVAQNKVEGVRLFYEAAKKGHPMAFDELKKAAEEGDSEALCGLGFCYMTGLGGAPKDPAKALDAWQKAADKDSARAYLSLGLAAAQGFGMPQDLTKAVEYWQKAGEYPDALRNLARCYEEGLGGLKKDPSKAAALMKRAKDIEKSLKKAK